MRLSIKRCGIWCSVFSILMLPACRLSVGDPFGAPPRGAAFNCGPEYRYKFEVKIHSAREFVDFLKRHGAGLADAYGNNWVQLDNFKDIEPGMDRAEVEQTPVDWERVLEAVVVEKVAGRDIFRLDYQPYACMGQQFTLKMTQDGRVSLYGCCGK
jgi:hypothetical protein